MKKPTLCLIDGSSYFYRAFFAVRPLTTSSGLHANAIYGFTTMMMKVLKDLKPDYVAMVYDSKEETFRHEIYEDYKANRDEMPDDLAEQIPYIYEVTKAFNIHALKKSGYEADDLIATACKKFKDENLKIQIISADKDLMQLVTKKVTMVDTMRDRKFGIEEVTEKFGVGPDKVVDILGLAGDASDNIPGVPGIGPKTATVLIQKYGDIETLLTKTSELKGKQKENLEKYKKQALLSKKLVILKDNVPIKFSLEDLKHKAFNEDTLFDLFSTLEFKRLIIDLDLSGSEKNNTSTIKRDYACVTTKKAFEEVLTKIKKAKELVLDLETTSLNVRKAKIVGFALAYPYLKKHEACYIPIGHKADKQLSKDFVVKELKALLESGSIKVSGQNIKYDYSVLANNGIVLSDVSDDSMISSYVLNPAEPHNLDWMAHKYMNHRMISYAEVTGKGKDQIGFDEVPLDKATAYAAEDADLTYRLVQLFNSKLKKEKRVSVYSDIEMPLVPILAQMELAGIKINRPFLKKMSKELDRKILGYQKEIYEHAGGEFNIQSPKQLSEILFTKLNLPVVKKTKTGFSTNEEVLKKLADQHPLPEKILSFRELAKLKSTYVDALLELADPKTDRVHTSFNQTIAETGRLSSSEPNLQNIPIRSEMGQKIREAFVAKSGHVLLSCDYSQVELRLLAHMSKDPELVRSFKEDLDIHSQTAAEVFGIFPEMVTSEMRRTAKAINFGLIYGLSAFGLSKQIGISVNKATDYIETYFKKYKKIKTFMNKLKEQAAEQGYAETLLGRRRFIPELSSANPQLRGFGERMAINTPIQGTAADLIKIAMINIDQEFKKKKIKTKMLLQVHDELVFEVPTSELPLVTKIVQLKMENALKLSVPIKVDIHSGKNWALAH